MKSIGFRSSVIAMSDGAHVVVPNSDLLQEHITNWTLGKNIKRLKLTVSVAYGTDLKAAVTIIQQLLQDNEHILSYPAAAVSPAAFQDSGIEIELLFWVGSLAKAHEVRGAVMEAICGAFAAAGIAIPFPQQEILIKNLPGEADAGASA
jgi:small-conductance mechanosensitive channel